MSETRRLARALVETETLHLDSRHGRAESVARLRESARAFHTELDAERVVIAADHARFVGRWEGGATELRLEGTFEVRRATRLALYGMSVAMLLLVVLSIRLAFFTEEGAARFLVPMFTVLAVLGLPFVVTGMGSVAEADRSRIRKALRVALQEGD